MISKRDIPLNLLKSIEEVAQANLDIIKLRKEENTYYCFVETTDDSKNFFKIFIDSNTEIGSIGRDNYGYDRKPSDKNLARHSKGHGTLIDVTNQFKEWIEIIRAYQNTPSIHDDNFSKVYSDFYYEEFKILDEDEAVSPFNPAQQEIFELYLDYLTLAITSSSEIVTDDFKKVIIDEIDGLKSDLPILTKKQVMRKISNIFGTIFKTSKKLAKEVVEEAGKQMISKLIELGIEYAPKIIESISRI